MVMAKYHLPKQIKLERKDDLCGYVSPEGVYYHCNHYEHEELAKKLVPEFSDLPFGANLYLGPITPFGSWRKPKGMSSEEYYLMYRKHYIKISSFKDSIDQMWLFSYYELTSEQTDFIYPR